MRSLLKKIIHHSKNTTKQIIIKDDFNGNLYSSNAHSSRSRNSLGVTGSVSSSLNYVGNVYYDLGVAVLTDTGSWSGSKVNNANGILYTDVGKKWGALDTSKEKDYRFWDAKFNSTTPIFTSQYSIKVNAGDFNTSTNETARVRVSSSIKSGASVADYMNVRAELTGSNWKPYFNQIQLFRSRDEEPLLIANLPRAVKIRDDLDIIVTFRVDH